jgi:hypothetical protein
MVSAARKSAQPRPEDSIGASEDNKILIVLADRLLISGSRDADRQARSRDREGLPRLPIYLGGPASHVAREVSSAVPSTYETASGASTHRSPLGEASSPAPHVSCRNDEPRHPLTKRSQRRAQRRPGPRSTTRSQAGIGRRLLVLIAVVALVLLAVASFGGLTPSAATPSPIL